MLQQKEELRMNTIKEKEQCNTTTNKDTKHDRLQDRILIWMHLNLRNSYGILKTFTFVDIRGLEGNAELRTILFQEGGIDTIMDGLQPYIKQEKHNCIKTLVKPIKSSCTKPTELADHCLNKEGHLQKGIFMNMEAWQDQEEAKGSLPAKQEQNKRLLQSSQTAELAEHHIVCQTTL